MFGTRSHSLPASVEAEIISRLFNALPQIGFVTACFVAGTALIASETGDAWTWAIFGVAVVTSLARVAGVLAYRRLAPKPMTLEQARRWERAYSLPALAFTVGIALLTIRVFVAEWTNGEILAVGLTMALTAGSCARTLRYWLCATLSTIALSVLIAMLLFSGDPVRIGLAGLFALYLLSIYESSRHIIGQVEALLIAERELDAAARRDPLTGLANRRAFDEALAEAATGGGFALLLLDLDGFKAVNDRLGHAAGDELLRQVAARLSSMLRAGDILTRLGGDEFAAILPAADARAAKAIADRAVALAGLPYAVLGAPARVGISIGVEVVETDDAVDGQLIKEAADRALYAAKAAGKGRAVLARAA